MSFFNLNVYVLKRRWGIPVDLYCKNTNSLNVQTGIIDLGWTRHHIHLAVCYPNDMVMQYINPKANLLMDINNSLILVDTYDLPRGVIIQPEFVFGVKNTRYDIKSIKSNQNWGNYIFCEVTEMVGAELPTVNWNLEIIDGFSLVENEQATNLTDSVESFEDNLVLLDMFDQGNNPI